MAMTKVPFNGELNSNEIFSSIYNMIISQQVFVPDLANNYGDLVSKFKVDGSLYGDTKLFYATDVLKSRAWGNYAEAANLLNTNKPADPKCQAITLDQFRQIDISLDNYLSKRAWSTEAAFSDFHSVVLGLVRGTKELYEVTLFNSYVGTTKGGANRSNVEIDVAGARGNASSEEEANRLEAQKIAQDLADLLIDMKDYSRDFNDYKFMAAYGEKDLMFIFNSKWINKITKLDLPTIFHNDKLIEKLGENVLPGRYFGTTITSTNISDYSASTPAAGKPIDSDDNTYVPGSNHANGCIRSLVEKDVTVSSTAYHVFPGDEIPAGATIVASTGDFLPGEVYIEDPSIICKIVTSDTYKFMDAFEVGTEFFNPRALVTNHYLTFGYSAPDYLRNKPLVTVSAKLS